ncbi:hypothetical protein [Anabaena sp. PCC 7108]|uniref:hypothetical protein n=1 Tax=Anabaena sp. PCC 7108 TaxID=163908 RepID=UPI00130E88CA|nr:hypothetical protein [Anabaena sp. PCC 7108]
MSKMLWAAESWDIPKRLTILVQHSINKLTILNLRQSYAIFVLTSEKAVLAS